MNIPNTDPRLDVVEAALDCDNSEQPFGKRWRQETISLTETHIEALRQGKCVAVDVQGEYVVYLKLDSGIKANRKEIG